MQVLEIGTRVIVSAISKMGYEDSTRIVERSEIVPADAVVTGRSIRFLGEYNRARGGIFGDGEDYEQASLAVSGSVELWCVRFGSMNREQLVQDTDLKPGSISPDTAGIPKRAKQLTYIASPESPVTIVAGEVKRITFKEPILLT